MVAKLIPRFATNATANTEHNATECHATANAAVSVPFSGMIVILMRLTRLQKSPHIVSIATMCRHGSVPGSASFLRDTVCDHSLISFD